MIGISHINSLKLVLVSGSEVFVAPLARASSPHEAMVVREAFVSTTRATVRNVAKQLRVVCRCGARISCASSLDEVVE